MDVKQAMEKYFESMVVYRISSIVSTLTRYQVELLTKKGEMTPEEMDESINLLEDIRKLLDSKATT